MFDLQAQEFFSGVQKVNGISFSIRQVLLEGELSQHQIIYCELRENIIRLLLEADEFFVNIGAVATSRHLRRVSKLLNEQISYREADMVISGVTATFFDEISDWKIIVLDKDTARLFDCKLDDHILEIITRFPTSEKDIREASICIALGRWRAAAFHCLGVIEVGIRAVCREVDVEIDLAAKSTTWQRMYDAIKRQLEPQQKDQANRGAIIPAPRQLKKPETWHEDEEFFYEFLNDLKALQRAYRNPTMHYRNLLEFDERGAKKLLNCTIEFMHHLSGKVKEPCDN